VRFRRRARRRNHDERAGEAAVVLGQEMADAIEREERHRAVTGAAASPLAGVAYDQRAGELDLHRFVESPVDTAVGEFAASYERLGPEEAGEVRAALSLDDFYTLLAFVRRSVLAALRHRSNPPIHLGLVALTAIDRERVDWRDVAVAAELVAWAIARTGGDHAAELQQAARRCEPGVAEALSGIAARPAAELEPGMWRAVETAAGPILADDYFERFEPTIDLVGIALAVQDVIEGDAYRVSGMTVATDLPPVWLTATDPAALERALDRARACVGIHAELDPGAAPAAEDQQLLVFLADASSIEDARLLAAAAVPTESHEALGVAEGTVCCVVIGSSTVIGVPAFERDGSLERFEEPLRSALEESRRAGLDHADPA
jgi:hypothetical protein